MVFHSIKLFGDAYWDSIVGNLFGFLMLISVIAAFYALFGRIGTGRRAKGKIVGLTPYDEVGVIEATIEIDKKWKGHKAGQFAFLMTNPKEGAHPYTIASEWRSDTNELTFIIKALGDWTRQLRGWMKLDMPVTVEGPYGDFDFDDTCSHQVWVATGIGVTPFIAKMKERAESKPDNKVDLFLAVPIENAEIQARLEQRAVDASVTLHWYITEREERLSVEDIYRQIDDLSDTSVWFCGATLLGNSLNNYLVDKGLSKKNFHQELFEFR
ncbi:putative oxidoreductase [Vibrio ishigakensis]|uniref:Putative oxidoreductase n=1 Tax=Vibrio ishigakensis TaxID=1481914 RepID=A0A0B8P7J0_9VIBR|nr:putative oxidoreductase [Vibrio ishigakensis]